MRHAMERPLVLARRRLEIDLSQWLVGEGAPLSASTSAPRFPRLTRREHDVLLLIVFRHTDREIADLLGISTRTASSHVSSILGKLDVMNRREAARVAMAIMGWESQVALPAPYGG